MVLKRGLKLSIIVFLIIFSIISISNFIYANTYVNDLYFIVPNTVYTTGERIEIKGFLFQTNYTSNGTLVSSSSAQLNATINLTITNTNGTLYNNYTFTTDSLGAFYSLSNYYSTATQILAPPTAGNYRVKAQYLDPTNSTKFSTVEISVVNQTIDILKISSEKAKYNPAESIKVTAEAIKQVGDQIMAVANISANGTLRNSSKALITSFNCITGNNGICNVYLTAPSTYGNYILELNNYKSFGSLSVIPFSYTLNMKDELGKSLKNVFALGEQARIEVKVSNASTTDEYTFSGYISDSSGSNIKIVNSTILNNNNSFTNSFLFTVDAITFGYGVYTQHITVTKTGDGSISSITSFRVEDWVLSINKRTSNSGFEYEYNTFSNKTLKFEAFPTFRSNGTIIKNITLPSFTISLKDNLNNQISSVNMTWNSTCSASGCYEFNITSPLNAGKYTLSTTLSYSGSSQTDSRIINVINGVLSAQSTDKDGNLKELFGTNEYVYLSLTSYNKTSSQFNLSNAEILKVVFMNGSEFSYTELNNSNNVNLSNSINEWAWNITTQKLKLDAPRYGGVYTVQLFGDNRTLGATAKFIVNPYDACVSTKDTAGTVVSGQNYYVWQFKPTDTIYFEIKLTQANNPLGRAISSNSSNSNSTGLGAQCNIDTQTKQVVSNATLSIIDVKNLESGSVQNINSTESVCQSTDSSGGYSCTVKPYSKWEGGQNVVKFKVVGQDGTSTTVYGRFESRVFYLYGWSSIWQNSPSNNITLNVQMYEAGRGWWGSSGGLSGTVSVKKVEYQGRDGEWIWPPVDSGYNVSALNSSTITTYMGTINLPVSNLLTGLWKTGNYRVILQGTTTAGDTDYGYAWFGVKLWDVYGSPIECSTTRCDYKSYFNSKENITMYIKISKAGDYNYNYQGGQNIWGNTTVKVKKIQDCRKWPCQELNSSTYISSTITVNASSPWYWGASSINQSNYLIYINKSSGNWDTGYYSVILDVNGTDTGYAWFNTIAFYIDAQPTNSNGSAYKSSIRGNSPMYFNVTTTKNNKNGYYSTNANGSSIFLRFNESDFINATLDSASLRTWDQQTYQSKEYKYPQDINITPNNVTGNRIMNITYNNGTWPTGYYWGELTLKNSDNETSSGWLWFNVQPFRVQISSSAYNVDSDQCINASLNVYDSDWYSNTPLSGNYSIINVYENVWSNSGSSITTYTNFTSSSFNATANVTFCPNNAQWGSGSWGGYHYLNIIVRDNAVNDTQTGWLSFRTIPFQVTWGSVAGGSNKLTNQNFNITVSLTKSSTGENVSGNLTKLYQWKYDNYRSTKEEYVFQIGNCYSNVSGQCTANSTSTIIVYAPSGGWKMGSNYIQSEWTSQTNSLLTVQDWSGVYIEGREVYNGYFSNSDISGNYKYFFNVTENITIKLFTRDNNYNSADLTITNVQYSIAGGNCWSESCRTYTIATFSPTSTSGGQAILQIKAPSGGWTRGDYYIKSAISGSGGTATITGGNVRVKDMIAPNITLISPVNNLTYNTTILFSATTSENSQCWVNLLNYDNFYNWYCGGWNATANITNGTAAWALQDRNACNTTAYTYNGSSYYTDYISNNYKSSYDGAYNTWQSGTFLSTGGTSHSYNVNVSSYPNQSYGMHIGCYDDDYNYGWAKAAFKVNNTIT